MTAPVILAPHDPNFAQRAKEEHDAWQRACGPALLTFHHIGSTAVPGLVAKPVPDLLSVFTSLAALDSLRPQIEDMGFEWREPYGLDGRRYCYKRSGHNVWHVHAYAQGHPAITRHIAFRDYLCAHGAEAAEYATVKSDCAARYRNDRSAYVSCKSAWIIDAEARALMWASKDRK